MGTLVCKTTTVTVTTAGTRVKVLSNVTSNIFGVILQPQSGSIVVGDITVVYATPIGIKVASTDAPLRLPLDSNLIVDLSNLYIDASADGTKVNVMYFVRA